MKNALDHHFLISVHMNAKVKILGKVQSESFLIGILCIIKIISRCEGMDNDTNKRGRPYAYPTTVIIRCFIVRIWLRIPSNNCLHQYFTIDTKHNRTIMKACGLYSLPDERTFDRRFKVLPIQDIISKMGRRFVMEGLADAKIVCVDSTLIHASNRRVWHKRDIIQDRKPRSGIDSDARWGFTRTKGWIFGYKLHISCSTGMLTVPLSADFTAANVYDNQMYYNLIEPLSTGMTRHVVADAGYDDRNLYDYTRQKDARLVCPIRRYRHTRGERLQMIRFYRSKHGRRIHNKRSVSVEPLFQCMKDTFGISVAPVRGFENVSSYVLMCVLAYQIAVYYNCVMDNDNPRCVKRMLGN